MSLAFHLLGALEPLSVPGQKREADGVASDRVCRLGFAHMSGLVCVRTGRPAGCERTCDGIRLKALLAHHLQDALPKFRVDTGPPIEYA